MSIVRTAFPFSLAALVAAGRSWFGRRQAEGFSPGLGAVELPPVAVRAPSRRRATRKRRSYHRHTASPTGRVPRSTRLRASTR